MGYVHKDHLSALWDTPQDYSTGDDILARVLYVLPTVKLIYLSLKKELFDPEAIIALSKSVKFGDIVKKAKVSLYLGGIFILFWFAETYLICICCRSPVLVAMRVDCN